MEFEKEERELGRLIKDKGTEKERIIRAEVVVLKTERVREGTSEKKKTQGSERNSKDSRLGKQKMRMKQQKFQLAYLHFKHERKAGVDSVKTL